MKRGGRKRCGWMAAASVYALSVLNALFVVDRLNAVYPIIVVIRANRRGTDDLRSLHDRRNRRCRDLEYTYAGALSGR